MPSATLQKLASSLSSGGGGAADVSPSSSNRGGVIRGILQSLRAHTGFSGGADSGSPRGSRSGHCDGSRTNTPRCSQSQHGLVLNADGLHTDLEDWEHEEVRSRFSSGASGIAPAIPPRMAIFGDNNAGQEQKLRSHSERRLDSATTDLACAQRDNSSPCLAAQLAEALKPEASGSGAGFKAGIASRLSFAGFRAPHGPTVPETSSPDTSAIRLQDLSNSQTIPVAPSSVGAGSRPGSRSASRPASGTRSSLELISPSAEPTGRHSNAESSPTVGEHKRTPTPAQVRPSMGLRACKASQQQRLPEAAAGDPLSGLPPPPQPQPPQPQPRAPPVQAPTPAAMPDAQAAAASPAPRRAGAFSSADSVAAAIANGEVIVVPSSGSASGAGGRSPEPDAENAGTDVGAGGTAAAAAADPAGAAANGVSAPVRFAGDPAAQRHCRSASTNELSAAAVSQAVQRLQLRQQQERAAGRFHRTSPLHHQHGNHHNHQAAATTQRVLSVASDGSGGGGDSSLPPPQQPYSPAPQQLSPAHRLGLHQARASSATSSFPSQNTPHFQQALYDSHRGATAAAAMGAAAGAQRGRAELNSGLDEWLGDVPDMSSGRLVVGPKEEPATVAAAATQGNTEQRSSISYTEGRISAAERLQAMVSSAASGDDAASYLQQLLIPDIPSTASVELHYSNTHNRLPSVLALAYGSSSGPPAGPNGSGLWGGVLGMAGGGGGCALHCGGSPMGQQSNCEPLLGLGSTEGNARFASGQGGALTPDWYQTVAGGGSGNVSRAGSGFLTSTPPAAALSGVFCGSFAHHAGSFASSTGALLSNGSGSVGTATKAAAAAAAADHAGKSAKQLVGELRELYAEQSGAAAAVVNSPSTGGRDGGGGGGGGGNSPHGVRPESSSAAPLSLTSNEEPREALGDAAPPPSSYGNGVAVGAQPRTASLSLGRSTAALPNALQRHVQREELVAALWRLVRAKDSDSVSYLLAIDPGEKANRPIAAMLQDMRSWVYLNMW